jgi:hypothetical protein
MRRLVGLVVGALALASCQLDAAVDVVVDPDGTGTVGVVATVDADVVAAVPTLAADLVLDDVAAAGWVIDGPNETPDGGLSIALSHEFADADDATNLLRSLGPPFNQVELTRTTSGAVTTTRITGLFGLTDGFASFADEELIALLGSAPFADELEASGATPAESIDVTFRATLPGEIVDEGTNAASVDGNVLTWDVPTDGSVLELRAESRQEPPAGGAWARPVSIVALVALIAWVAFMTVFIGYVAVARWRRSRRRRRRR